jgi:asparagine synthetase B (glutamine-hydrolysing)
MCGIFGILVDRTADFNSVILKNIINQLFILSESRGKEASGIAVFSDGRTNVIKEPLAARHFIRKKEYIQFLDEIANGITEESSITKKSIIVIGHTRLATNGTNTDSSNNHPIICGNVVGVHNGIVVNDGDIWKKFLATKKRKGTVDSEVVFNLLEHFINNGLTLVKAMQVIYEAIEGSSSLAAIICHKSTLILSTNTGSLYYCKNAGNSVYIFASELHILKELIKDPKLFSAIGQYNISQLKPGYGAIINIYEPKESIFNLGLVPQKLNNSSSYNFYNDKTANNKVEETMKRCTKCILPETMPFIKFNKEGICNYCLNYKKIEVKGEEALQALAAEYRSKNGGPDCIVAFSGGRDSSYGLHYVKKVLKMNPIAFTFDWGVVTDIARRNQARLVGKLGIEHIILAADIKKKRRYIRQYVKAWIRRPNLGMVPLFMAGDKPVEYYVTKIAKKYGIKLIFLCRGNEFETTEYKFGFLGVKHSEPKGVMHEMALWGRIKLALAAGWQYFLNPSYLNNSLFETLFAYWTTYIIRYNFIYLYHYMKWDEEKIIYTLKREYNWETERDTILTWRTDDGTAPFYNYIYCTVAGFTENDAFRSNQIREGVLTRERALKIIEEENKPRYEAIRDYLDKIGLDYDEVIKRINAIPKLYPSYNQK